VTPSGFDRPHGGAAGWRGTPLGGERGSVSLLSAGVLVALVVLAMGASDVARVLHAASRAQTAADAAALAAAQALAIDDGGPTPAELADEYAARNGAVLDSCMCEPGTFEASVGVRMPVGDLFLVTGDRTVRARARAKVDLPAS
jgi:secretion/DNA translocation related TadE-like protein